MADARNQHPAIRGIVTFGGVGTLPGAPGTWGSAAAIPLTWALHAAGGIALVIGVDRVIDMTRTVVNVTGDLTACLVLERWVGDALPDDDETPASTAPPIDGPVDDAQPPPG